MTFYVYALTSRPLRPYRYIIVTTSGWQCSQYLNLLDIMVMTPPALNHTVHLGPPFSGAQCVKQVLAET